MSGRRALAPSDGRRAQSTLVGRGADSERALTNARACFPSGSEAQQHVLARHLAAMFALDDALDSDTPLSSPTDEQRTLLPWLNAPPGGDTGEIAGSRASIRSALAQVERDLLGSRPREGARNWWRKQGELMVAACWQEARWRMAGTLPDEDSYLTVAEISIGIGWIVASLLLLDGATLAPAPDSPLVAATAAVAAAVRIANDLHETMRERREGKTQLLFLRIHALQMLGCPAAWAEQRGTMELHVLLSQRAARARALLDEHHWVESKPLRSALLSMLSTALDLIQTPSPTANHMLAATSPARI